MRPPVPDRIPLRDNRISVSLACVRGGIPQPPAETSAGQGLMEPANTMTSESEAKCEKCGKPMVIRSGRHGKFVACTGYPECKNTRNLPREPPPIITVADCLYWSYANLCMAHAALRKGVAEYGPLHIRIREKFWTGVHDGSMNVGPIADDERLKRVLDQACCYCGTREHPAVDHMIPTSRGGQNGGDNMVWSCRSCNSSKGTKDVLEWLDGLGKFPPLLLLRRYLKLAIEHCKRKDILTVAVEEADVAPFSLRAIPHTFPPPAALRLWTIDLP